MRIFVIHPSGNNFNRNLLSVLSEHNMLAEFETSIAVTETSLILKVLPSKIRHEFLRRTFPVAHHLIRTHPLREFLRLLLPKIGLSYFTRHEKGWASFDAVYNYIDDVASRRLTHLSKKQSIDAVYAYEDAALATFTAAKERGIKCIYDLPIAYWETGRKLMDEEAERLPDWAFTLKGGVLDSPKKLARKVKELELADVVVVPSQFVKDSLPAWASKKKIVMAPFGSPVSGKVDREYQSETSTRKLRVLFTGSMTQRKGLADLFAAMKILNRSDIELVVMGSLRAPLAFYKQQYVDFIYEAGRPHDKVLELMRSCDVFCLPSIVEGRALVMQEAMSQGLPLIITPNTGGADLVIEGKTGFVVPIRNPEAIAEKLKWFLDNRNALPAMGNAAIAHAANYTWEAYNNKIIAEIKNVDCESKN